MIVAIDPKSPTPPFEQLRGQVVEQVRTGSLAAGTRLPTVRRLAEDLGVAPGTVARAYRELEADGLIETRGRNGTFIRPQGDPGEQAAQEAARAYADRILRLGVTPAQALAYARAALGA